MVRLEVSLKYRVFSNILSFQFQYGAIRRIVEGIKDIENRTISIPVWCD